MNQDSSHLEDYTPPAPGDEVESAGGCFLPVAGYGRLRLLVDQGNGTFKGATRELTVDRVAHVPNLGRHNLLSTKRRTYNSVRCADARLPSRRNHSTPFRLQDARFPLLMSRNWLPRNQGPPSRRYEGAANAANGSAIDSDSQGDHNPSTSWCHARPSAPCSASTLTTRDEPFASATSPPAKSSCVRRPYGTPQPKRQFSVTRRLKGGGGGGRDTGIIPRDPRQPPTTCPHWRAGKPFRRSRNRNRMDQRGRVGRKVHLSWKEWSMRWVEFLGQRGRARTSKIVSA